MKLVYAWFYYSFYYLLLGSFVSIFIIKFTRKIYLAPLIVNAISGLILFALAKYKIIDSYKASYALYFNYMPTVVSSIFTSLIFLMMKIKENNKK